MPVDVKVKLHKNHPSDLYQSLDPKSPFYASAGRGLKRGESRAIDAEVAKELVAQGFVVYDRSKDSDDDSVNSAVGEPPANRAASSPRGRS